MDVRQEKQKNASGRMMKKRIIVLALALAALVTPAQMAAGGHDKTFGVKGGYISRNESMSAGLYFQYGFTQSFRLAAQTDVAFRHANRDAWLIDVNAQFPLVKASRFEFYPLVGANYSAWSIHHSDPDSGDDVTTRKGRFGLNAGVGAGVRVTPTLKLTLEGVYTAVKQNNAARVSLGIGYCF